MPLWNLKREKLVYTAPGTHDYPELQPAEKLLPIVNEVCANQVFEDIVELEKLVEQRCRNLLCQTDLIRGMTFFHPTFRRLMVMLGDFFLKAVIFTAQGLKQFECTELAIAFAALNMFHRIHTPKMMDYFTQSNLGQIAETLTLSNLKNIPNFCENLRNVGSIGSLRSFQKHFNYG